MNISIEKKQSFCVLAEASYWLSDSQLSWTDRETDRHESSLGQLPARIELWHKRHLFVAAEGHVMCVLKMWYSFTAAGDAVSGTTARTRGLKAEPWESPALKAKSASAYAKRGGGGAGGDLPHGDSWSLCLYIYYWEQTQTKCVTVKKKNLLLCRSCVCSFFTCLKVINSEHFIICQS